jgi:hypothetical protein
MAELSFSQRHGYKPIRAALQIESMDAALRNSIWNSLRLFVFDRFSRQFSSQEADFINRIWRDYFKEPMDEAPRDGYPAIAALRERFLRMQWFEIYDFIEFLIPASPYISGEVLVMELNYVLVREGAGYRIIDQKVTPIVSETDIKAIESALAGSPSPMLIHLKTAINLLSDRHHPDYRNSIKESISAVESICKIIAKDDTADLAKALRRLNESIPLHGALKVAFEKLYAYTSDAEGIRHSLLDESTLDHEDALFMLVSCSAFINYLITKAGKAGIALTT